MTTPFAFSPTPDEASLVDRILRQANPHTKLGDIDKAVLDADSAVDIFLGTQLSPETLSIIWTEADEFNNGFLNRHEVAIALRLIGWAQSGEQVLDRSLLEKESPLAVVAGIEPRVSPQAASLSLSPLPTSKSPRSPLTPATSKSPQVEGSTYFEGSPASPSITRPNPSYPSPPSTPFVNVSTSRRDIKEWNISPLLVSHATKLFDKIDTSHKGFVETDEAIPVLGKSNLSQDDLSKIWHLASAGHPEHLTKDGFIIAMFLVHQSLAGLGLPESLPESFPSTFSPRSPEDAENPFLNAEDEPAPSAEEPSHDKVRDLHAQISTLQDALATVGQENDDLRSSLQTMTRLSRQHTLNNNRMSRNVDSGLTEIVRLQAELEDRDNALTRLRASVRVSEDLSRENAVFRLQVEELTSRLEISTGDVTAQKLLAEELSRESERLKRQLETLRESSTSVPSINGDEELQTLINEDLSRENRRLRNQVKDSQDSLAQLQTTRDELDVQRENTRALTRENRRLKGRVRELESASATAQNGTRQRVEDLGRENERLRRELEQGRRRPARQGTDPPPAYTEVTR